MQRLLSTVITAAALSAGPVQAAVEPTFVLVHGALFTESGWAPLKAELESQGSHVVTLNVPGRANDGIDPKSIDIKTAADKVRDVVQSIAGPVILVGHSQGGAVITQAFGDLADSDKVKALVYVAAVVPADGETAFDGLNAERDTNFGLTVTVDPEAGLFRLNRKGPLESSFFQDLRAINPRLADDALASMVSEPIGIGTSKLSFNKERYNRVPKYYVEATEDRIISIETQREYQAKVAFDKVYSVAAGHSPFLSQPGAVASALKDAARLVELSNYSFPEIIWEQNLPNLELKGELSGVQAISATLEIHYVRRQKFDATIKLLNSAGYSVATINVPVQNVYADFCGIMHFDTYDAAGVAVNITDFQTSQCESSRRSESVVEIFVGGQRSVATGEGLRAHIPGF